uniref:NADH-ubiquinone oxidoreductase chain 3 n=1 Tax=Pselaphinae sp. 10 EF-2015 TaxID=1756854 RepID=A0A0S2M8X1_9COLE|nr:NADH deshydrogenase subunit 3 [Pselaphinae sp. 10 EF-2015]
MLLMMSMMILIISMILMMISSLISKKSIFNREKSTPFECGFDPKSSPRLSFSLHFFMIAIVFLIFDIEITMLIPLIFIMKSISMMNLFLLSMIFLSILLLGLYYEWSQGALNWLF